MLDKRAIRAHLTLMNMQAPFEQQWVAEVMEVSEHNQTQYDVHQQVRFWLVGENAECLSSDNMIKGDRVS